MSARRLGRREGSFAPLTDIHGYTSLCLLRPSGRCALKDQSRGGASDLSKTRMRDPYIISSKYGLEEAERSICSLLRPQLFAVAIH